MQANTISLPKHHKPLFSTHQLGIILRYCKSKLKPDFSCFFSKASVLCFCNTTGVIGWWHVMKGKLYFGTLYDFGLLNLSHFKIVIININKLNEIQNGPHVSPQKAELENQNILFQTSYTFWAKHPGFVRIKLIILFYCVALLMH